MRLLIYAAVLAVTIVVMFVASAAGPVFGVASGLAIGFAIPLIDSALLYGRHFRIGLYGLRTWKKRVRISASYLYRIRVDSEYLLVKGSRYDQYQPVGGVYKTHASSAGLLQDLEVLKDNLLPIDPVSRDDIRVRVMGRHLFSFVRWFEKGQGRETDAWREFYEELIGTGILPADPFKYVAYDVIGRHYEKLRFSHHADAYELLIADVVDLIPTDEQLAVLRRLKAVDDPRYVWVTEDQIRRRGAQPGTNQTVNISGHSTWII